MHRAMRQRRGDQTRKEKFQETPPDPICSRAINPTSGKPETLKTKPMTGGFRDFPSPGPPRSDFAALPPPYLGRGLFLCPQQGYGFRLWVRGCIWGFCVLGVPPYLGPYHNDIVSLKLFGRKRTSDNPPPQTLTTVLEVSKNPEP